MTHSDTSSVLPEIAAAERLRQHLQEIADERDRAHRALQEREAELARIQRIAGVGGLEIDFRDGVKNRRSPEYLLVHGLPPEAANESYEEWVRRIHPEHCARITARSAGSASSPRSSARPTAARCAWSAPISTSPRRCWRRPPCAKAR